jgi:hypothetical protein
MLPREPVGDEASSLANWKIEKEYPFYPALPPLGNIVPNVVVGGGCRLLKQDPKTDFIHYCIHLIISD